MKLVNTLLIISLSASISNKKIESDRSLIVPGKGGNGYVLYSSYSDIKNRLKNSLSNPRLIQQKRITYLIKNVLSFSCSNITTTTFDIPFKKALYISSKTALFFNNDRLTAIAIFNNKKVTHDMIDLTKGISAIIFRYGNKDLLTCKYKSHTIYVYLKKGIAFVDDNSDNSVDVILIFKKQK